MALENPTYISDLVSTNPTATDGLSQGDDHIRNFKSAVKATLPNLTGAVTATHIEINLLAGASSSAGDINAIENFEETISSTTSEITVAASKTLNITDSEKLKVSSIPVYGMVVLDVPTTLVASGSMATGAWTAVDSSTLNAAQAKKAIIKIEISSTGSGNTVLVGRSYVRKTGSGLVTDGRSSVVHASQYATSTYNYNIFGAGTTTVNLDTSFDFDYYLELVASPGTSSNNCSIVLVGYYV